MKRRKPYLKQASDSVKRTVQSRFWIGRLLLGIFVVFYVIAAILFGIGYAGAYLHPGTYWWTAIIAVGLPYLTIVLIVSTLAIAALKNRIWIAAHGLFLILIVLRFIDLGAIRPSPNAREGDIVLMTYNVPEREAVLRDIDPGSTLMHLIRDEEADVVSLQDLMVWLHGPPDELQFDGHLKKTIDTLGYTISRPADYGVGHYIRNAVVSRLGPLEQERIILGSETEDPVVTYVTRKLFRYEGRPFVHYNIHLRSFGDPKPWRQQSWSFSPAYWLPFVHMYRDAYRNRANEVEQLVEKIRAEAHPVVITGDLNSTPHNWEYRQLARGMQDAFKVAGSGWGATYHSRFPVVRIDFLLFGPEWEVISAHVPHVSLSDHRPVVARVRWRDE